MELVVYARPEAARTFDLRTVMVGGGDFSQARRIADENLRLAPLCRRDRVDVLFSPANFGAPALPLRIPQVVTVHDLQHHWLTENFSRAKRAQRTAMFRATFARAAHVIAISDFTRRDVLARYRVPPERISTVLEGYEPIVPASDAAIAECFEKHGISGGQPVLYYPATDNAHKNHEVLVDALARLRTEGRNPLLVMTGSRGERYETIEARARAAGVADQLHHLGFVDREDVYTLMSGADALVFPSRFEGFGLPILEAMQCNTPVIASNCASIPEVAGEAARLLAPDDPGAWADAITSLVDDSEERARLVAAGRSNLSRFSWTRCAEETAAIFERVRR